MTLVGRILNGSNLSQDAGFQAIPSATVGAGVSKDYLNECVVTTNQVATGRVFVEVTRDNVTPNETFLIPIEITAVETIDTSGTGYVYVLVDETAVNDGSTSAEDGTDLASIEVAASLPTKNYLLLATLSSGTITDARVFSELKDEILPDPMFYDEDAEVTDAYAITVNGVDSYVDGAEFAFKANTANTGAATLNVNGLGAKDIRKKYNAPVDTGDIEAGQILEVRYDADNDFFQMMTMPSTISSITTASQAEAEAGTDNSKMMTPLRTAQAIAAQRVFGGDGSDGDVDGTSNITITGSNNTYIVKNYSSWAAASGGAKTCDVTPTGCIVHIKIKGDADFTNWTFDFAGKGFAGGSYGQGNYPANATSGSSGSTPSTGVINGHTGGGGGEGGGGGSTGSNTGGGAGGGGGASAFNDGTAGSDSTGGTSSGGTRDGGVGGTKLNIGINLDYMVQGNTILVFPGAGGGGGGGGGDAGLSAGTGRGGVGGAGGGALIIEVFGDVTFSSTTVDVSGADGGDAPNDTSGDGGGGGGGGGGGTFLCVYGGSSTGSPTVDVSGGAGGLGQTANTYNGGDGGDGGDGDYAILQNTSFA